MEEKSRSFEREAPGATNMEDIKETVPAAQDVDLGQMLEVQSTPEEERKVLIKLDWVYVSLLLPLKEKSWGLGILTSQVDSHDGCMLHDAVHGQICPESSNTV